MIDKKTTKFVETLILLHRIFKHGNKADFMNDARKSLMDNHILEHTPLVLTRKWNNHIRLCNHFQNLMMVEEVGWNIDRVVITGDAN